jgi:hypothetical protein
LILAFLPPKGGFCYAAKRHRKKFFNLTKRADFGYHVFLGDYEEMKRASELEIYKMAYLLTREIHKIKSKMPRNLKYD